MHTRKTDIGFIVFTITLQTCRPPSPSTTWGHVNPRWWGHT